MRKPRRTLVRWLIATAVAVAVLAVLYNVFPLIFWSPLIVLACVVEHDCV